MSSCAAKNCKGKSRYLAKKNNEKIKMYSFPPLVRNAETLINKLKTKRCKAWLKAINRNDLKDSQSVKMQNRIKKSVLCGSHFVSGQPSDLFDITNKDWIPTLNLGYEPKLNYLNSLRPKKIEIPNVSGYSFSQSKFKSDNIKNEIDPLHETINTENELYRDCSGYNYDDSGSSKKSCDNNSANIKIESDQLHETVNENKFTYSDFNGYNNDVCGSCGQCILKKTLN